MNFYVETSDEYGPLEYARFATADEAIAEARAMVKDGWRYAVAIDAKSFAVLAKVGNCPADWN